jgi:hypothetical protein
MKLVPSSRENFNTEILSKIDAKVDLPENFPIENIVVNSKS